MTEEMMTKLEETEADEQSKEAIAEKEEKKPDAEPKEVRPVVFEEALEAILFAAGHPISYATLARVFEMTPGKVKDKVFEYSLRYNDPAIPRGVILLTYGDSCQLSTKQYYLNEIREALGIKKSGSLSTSSMEALAIVAYNQPVTRIFVDTLRRADSSYAMNNLLDRGLIEPKGRLDAPGRPMLYGTTSDFLRVFGLKDIYELPRTTEEMQDMFSKAKSVENAEGAVQEEMEFPEAEEKTNGEDNSAASAAESLAEENYSTTDPVEYDGDGADDAMQNDDYDEPVFGGIEADDVIKLDELGDDGEAEDTDAESDAYAELAEGEEPESDVDESDEDVDTDETEE